MSQEDPNTASTTEEQLSEEQLQGVAGGLSGTFKKEREQTLDANLTDEGELADEDLKGVAGGISETFKKEREQTLDANLTDSFGDARQRNLDN